MSRRASRRKFARRHRTRRTPRLLKGEEEQARADEEQRVANIETTDEGAKL
eukprot:COSAG02_NODE_28481_length_588_cov_3.057260_1_plen_50_part_10